MFPFAKLTCVLALGAAALCAQPIITVTVETTGMVGIAAGETARMNLLNPGVLAPAVGAVCTAGVSFIDAGNTVLKTGTLTITPGQSQFLDLRSDLDLSLTAGDRREIRAQFTVPSSCTLKPTLEVFDFITGRTEVVLGGTVAVPTVVTPASN